jgi:hypothetical protein
MRLDQYVILDYHNEDLKSCVWVGRLTQLEPSRARVVISGEDRWFTVHEHGDVYDLVPHSNPDTTWDIIPLDDDVADALLAAVQLGATSATLWALVKGCNQHAAV